MCAHRSSCRPGPCCAPGKPCPLSGPSLFVSPQPHLAALGRRHGSLTCAPSSLEHLLLRRRSGHLCASLSVLLESRVYATARLQASNFRPAESGSLPSPHCSPAEQVSSQCAQEDLWVLGIGACPVSCLFSCSHNWEQCGYSLSFPTGRCYIPRPSY